MTNDDIEFDIEGILPFSCEFPRPTADWIMPDELVDEQMESNEFYIALRSRVCRRAAQMEYPAYNTESDESHDPRPNERGYMEEELCQRIKVIRDQLDSICDLPSKPEAEDRTRYHRVSMAYRTASHRFWRQHRNWIEQLDQLPLCETKRKQLDEWVSNEMFRILRLQDDTFLHFRVIVDDDDK